MSASAAKRQDVDMTSGSIFRHIVSFAFPLFVGNIFQQLYNTVDTWVVGNYASNEAYSAVGTVGPIINLLIGTFMGFASGAGVVISQYYGAGQYEKVKKTVNTALAMTFIVGALFTAIGVLLTPYLLRLMKMPDTVFPEAKTYLTIYFSGLLSLVIYNMGAGILRAVGDSRRPFIFLVISSVINIVLDLLFVKSFGMGVAGVAIATVTAQTVSALLVLILLMRTDMCVKVNLLHMKPDGDCLKKIVMIGVPTSLQMALTAFSNIIVQSYINYFGPDCMSGWTSYTKIDHLLILPMQSISLAASTFVGQNLGKGDVKRAKSGIRCANIMALTATAVLLAPVLVFAPGLVRFFNSRAEVVEMGAMFLRMISPFYLFCAVNQIQCSALRGAGKAKTVMIMMLSSFVLFRQIYLFIVANFISNTIIPISMAYPCGWIFATLMSSIALRVIDLKKGRIVENN